MIIDHALQLYQADKDLAKAIGLADSFRKSGGQLLPSSVSTLCRIATRNGEYSVAWDVFDRMRYEGMPMTVDLYFTMISTCQRSNNAERALDLYTEMTQDKHLEPTQWIYDSLLAVLSKRKEYVKDALALLNTMRSKFILPTVYTYGALGAAAHRTTDVELMRRILLEMWTR